MRFIALFMLSGAALGWEEDHIFYGGTVLTLDCDKATFDSSIVKGSMKSVDDCKKYCKDHLQTADLNTDPYGLAPQLIDDAVTGCSFPTTYNQNSLGTVCLLKPSDNNNKLQYLLAIPAQVYNPSQLNSSVMTVTLQSGTTATSFTMYPAKVDACGNTADENGINRDISGKVAWSGTDPELKVDILKFYQLAYKEKIQNHVNFAVIAEFEDGVTSGLDEAKGVTVKTAEWNSNQFGVSPSCAFSTVSNQTLQNSCSACLAAGCHWCDSVGTVEVKDNVTATMSRCGVPQGVCTSSYIYNGGSSVFDACGSNPVPSGSATWLKLSIAALSVAVGAAFVF